MTPQRGGVLSLVGCGDADSLDPALGIHTAARGLLRACTRQLVTYRAGSDQRSAGRVVADMATDVPTAGNGRLSADGRSYVFTLRAGLRWDDFRVITAADVARGIKRLAHPLAPSPTLTYFMHTITGMAEFGHRLAGIPAAVDIADCLETTQVDGIRVLDDSTIEFRTLNRAGDFLNILALPSATPIPAEYAAVVPGARGIPLRSNGPYRVIKHLPGQEILLSRNPAWDPATDDVRAAYLDAVHVRQGLAEDEAFRLVSDGAADMLWDIQPLTSELPALLSAADRRLEIAPAGLLSPYLAVNMLSPNEDHAAANLCVRQAISAALDRAAVSRVWGGPRLNDLAWQILPPLSSAHRPSAPPAGYRPEGNPGLARDLLTAAGFRNGIRLKLVHRDCDIHPESVREIRRCLGMAGIEIEPVPVSITELFSRYFASAEPARRGDWDLAFTGWEPDWHGNNARTYLEPLFDTPTASGGWNLGHYDSHQLRRLLEAARAAPDDDAADRFYRAAEAEVLRDVAVVPILFAHQYWFHSARVHNWLPYPVLNGDLTNIWLEPATPVSTKLLRGNAPQ